MKKARIALASIALLGVLGGTMAVKAKTVSTPFSTIWYTNAAGVRAINSFPSATTVLGLTSVYYTFTETTAPAGNYAALTASGE